MTHWAKGKGSSARAPSRAWGVTGEQPRHRSCTMSWTACTIWVRPWGVRLSGICTSFVAGNLPAPQTRVLMEAVALLTASVLTSGVVPPWVTITCCEEGPAGGGRVGLRPTCNTVTHTILNAWAAQKALAHIVPLRGPGASTPASVAQAILALGLPATTPVLVINAATTVMINVSWDAWVGRWLLATRPVWCTGRAGAAAGAASAFTRPLWGIVAGTAEALLRGLHPFCGRGWDMATALDTIHAADGLDADEEAGAMVWVDHRDGNLDAPWLPVSLPFFVGVLPRQPHLVPLLRAMIDVPSGRERWRHKCLAWISSALAT